jgi:hypothetical protein
MNSDNQISDGELEQEFQKLAHLDAEKLMPTLAKLHSTNPTLFDRLSAYADRRRGSDASNSTMRV